MTTMGLEYLKLLESNRANLANEQLKKDQLAETHRANLVSEGLQKDNLLETRRSNLAREAENERANRAREEEILRMNLAQESLQINAQDETKRANEAREKENERANMSRENIDIYKINLANMTPLQAQATAGVNAGYTPFQTGHSIITERATNILSSLFGTITGAAAKSLSR